MSTPSWGLLGPDMIESERRARTLGLGAAVREFNDLAVPGMGGVWFGKQLFLATLGVVVADAVRQAGKELKNIPCANAVEALSCMLAFKQNQWAFDARLSGRAKLNGKTDLSFANVMKPSFYVTQPMRMTTVQPLPALGLVQATGERFNSFAASDDGRTFVKIATSGGYAGASAIDTVLSKLTGWAMGKQGNIESSEQLRAVLSPHLPLSDASREFLRDRLQSGSTEVDLRRAAALAWVGELRKLHGGASIDDGKRKSMGWAKKPAMLSREHWKDMHAGALFFDVRDAAITLLDRMEALIANQPGQRIDTDDEGLLAVARPLAELRKRAAAFLALAHDPSPASMAAAFARECTAASNADVFRHIVKRDGKVLQLHDQSIMIEAPFRRTQPPEQDDDTDEERKDSAGLTNRIGLPKGISRRVSNLFLLNLDLHAELSPWLSAIPTTSGAN